LFTCHGRVAGPGVSAQINCPRFRVALLVGGIARRIVSEVEPFWRLPALCRHLTLGNTSNKRRSVPWRSAVIFIGICEVRDVHLTASELSNLEREVARRLGEWEVEDSHYDDDGAEVRLAEDFARELVALILGWPA
jgi:hypothetical protein